MKQPATAAHPRQRAPHMHAIDPANQHGQRTRARLEADPFSRRSQARRVQRDRIAAPSSRKRPLNNATTAHPYTAPELRAPVRPGALDAYALPSRIGNRLHYRGGRIEDFPA